MKIIPNLDILFHSFMTHILSLQVRQERKALQNTWGSHCHVGNRKGKARGRMPMPSLVAMTSYLSYVAITLLWSVESATTKLTLIENNGNFLVFYFILICFVLFWFSLILGGVTNREGNQNAKEEVLIRAPIFLVTTSSPASECQSISTINSKLRHQVQPVDLVCPNFDPQ